jgi:peptidoglycan/xylan/chitin deacetylase (PgdA/CDA1 family)
MTPSFRPLFHSFFALGMLLPLLAGCQKADEQTASAPGSDAQAKAEQAAPAAKSAPAKVDYQIANELGRVPVLEYHRFGPVEERWTRTYDNFRKDLEWLYNNDYVLVNASDFAAGKLNVPAGKKPTILTFDDSTEGQFKYQHNADGSVKRDEKGQPLLDPNCAIAIMDAFYAKHPDFGRAGTFYVLPNAFETAQETSEKLKYLVATGREIGSHTFNHANLSKLQPAQIRENLAKAQAEVARELGSSFEFQTLALPFGIYPKSDEGFQAVIKGSALEQAYHHRAVMLVGADPAPSPFDKKYNSTKVPRIQAIDDEWIRHFARKPGATTRNEERFKPFVSDGDAQKVTFPAKLKDRLAETYAAQANPVDAASSQ